MDNKVSIIMAVYNAEKTIADSIQSVLAQTYANFELLICDDSSTDSSKQIVQQFHDPRIHLFDNDLGKGCGFARKKALMRASGQYIAFLDSDDLWAKNKLAAQIQFIEKHQISFCFGNYYTINTAGQIIGQFIAPNQLSYSDLLKTNHIGCLTVLFTKSLLTQITIPVGKKEDYQLWLALLSTHAIQAYHYGGTDAYYRLSKKTLSSNKIKQCKNQWSVLKNQSLVFSKRIRYMGTFLVFGTLKHFIYYKRKPKNIHSPTDFQ